MTLRLGWYLFLPVAVGVAHNDVTDLMVLGKPRGAGS